MPRAQHGARTAARTKLALVAAGAVAVTATTFLIARGSPSLHPVAATSPRPSATASPSAVPAAGPDRLPACARRVHAAEAAIEAAGPGIADWKEHTQAFRDVLQDRSRYAVADRTWTRTRGAGPEDQARWTTAMSAYDATAGACDGLVAQAPPTQAALAQTCAARAEVADTLVQDAGALMSAWGDHLQQMRERSEGTLTRAQTNRLFAQATRQTPEEVQALEGDIELFRRAPACAG